jgi:hypothetical protein
MTGDRLGSIATSDYVTPPHSPIPLESAPPLPSPLNSASYNRESNPSVSLVASATGPEPDKEGATPGESTAFLPAGNDLATPPQSGPIATTPFRRRPVRWAVALAALVAVVLAAFIPVYLTVIHKSHGGKSNNAVNGGSGSGSGSGSGNPGSTTDATSGGNGSTIISGNTSFTYSNPFGGYCKLIVPYLHPLKFVRALPALKTSLFIRVVPFELFVRLLPLRAIEWSLPRDFKWCS